MKFLIRCTSYALLVSIIAGGVFLAVPGNTFGAKLVPFPNLEEETAEEFCASLLRVDWPPSPAGTNLESSYVGLRNADDLEEEAEEDEGDEEESPRSRSVFRDRGEGNEEVNEVPVCLLPEIADLIRYVYEWIIGITGLLVFLLLIIGGFQYAVSAGDAQKMAGAKSRIKNAIFGLILVLMSYLLLNLINPDIANIKDPFHAATEEIFLAPTSLGGTPSMPCTELHLFDSGVGRKAVSIDDPWAIAGNEFTHALEIYVTAYENLEINEVGGEAEGEWTVNEWYREYPQLDPSDTSTYERPPEWIADGTKRELKLVMTGSFFDEEIEKTYRRRMTANCAIVLYQETGAGPNDGPNACGSAIRQDEEGGAIDMPLWNVDLREFVPNPEQKIKCVQLISPGVDPILYPPE